MLRTLSPPTFVDRVAPQVLDLFDELHHQGMTILMVTHEADVAARAQRVLHFQDGRVLDPQLVG